MCPDHNDGQACQLSAVEVRLFPSNFMLSWLQGCWIDPRSRAVTYVMAITNVMFLLQENPLGLGKLIYTHTQDKHKFSQ